MQMEERRKLQRFDLQAQTTILADMEEGTKTLTLMTKDISSAGTFLLTTHPLPEGIPVHLEMLLTPEALRKVVGPSGAIRVTVNGKVVRREEIGMAIMFDGDYTMSGVGARGR